jgi:hypothetical protein
LFFSTLDKRDVVKAALSFGDLIVSSYPLGGPNIHSSSLPLLLVEFCIIPPMELLMLLLSCWGILLEWACKTGDAQPRGLPYHQDGNKSHFMETMWLGGKSDSKPLPRQPRK